jgi:hypothetical protein
MRNILERRPSAAMVVAFVALLAALSGTAVALPGRNTVDSGDIKNNNVRGKDIRRSAVGSSDVKNEALTGGDINESTLGKVPSATSADNATNANNAANADSVGGTPLGGLLQVAGCQTGKVLGFARIKGEAAAFPTTYTSSPAFVDIAGNCSGGPVQVRRVGVGQYFIRFAGNPALLAVAQNNIDIDGSFADDHDTIVNVGKITAGADAGAFRVETYDAAQSPANVNAAADDADVTILLP